MKFIRVIKSRDIKNLILEASNLILSYDESNYIKDECITEENPLYKKVFKQAQNLNLNPSYSEFDSYGFKPDGITIKYDQENNNFNQFLKFIRDNDLEIYEQYKTKIHTKTKGLYIKVKMALHPINLKQEHKKLLIENGLTEAEINELSEYLSNRL